MAKRIECAQLRLPSALPFPTYGIYPLSPKHRIYSFLTPQKQKNRKTTQSPQGYYPEAPLTTKFIEKFKFCYRRGGQPSQNTVPADVFFTTVM